MPLEIARTKAQVSERLASCLRTESADDQRRDHLRVVLGPQPYQHNHFQAERFFETNELGSVHDIYGQRALRVTGNFLAALTATLRRETPDQEHNLLFQIGRRWGVADFTTFIERVQQEFEIEFEKLPMGLMLETWWWPLRASGWGAWRFDIGRARQGLITIDLMNSAVASALGQTGSCACHIYAGLFAAVFGVLAKRELACLEMCCACRSDAQCKFVVATKRRIDQAAHWRDEGSSSEEIARKLIEMGQR